MNTPEQQLAKSVEWLKNLNAARKGYVAVGLPKEKVGGEVYGNPEATIIRVGAIHEYGRGNVPQRSFLRVPFLTKKAELADVVVKQFKAVATGKRSAADALGLIGTAAVNISVGAFTTLGYGKWPEITEETKKAKRSSQTLIDKGILRNSITYVVRGL